MTPEPTTLDLHVMVVDDEPLIRDLVGRVLQLECREVTVVGSGAEAVALLASSSIDLVVTDLRMPGVDGLGVLRAARAKDAGIDVVVMSGFVDRDAEVALEGHGATVLRKPFDPRALVTLVREIARCR